LTVDAALRADRGLFVEALLADGSVADPDVAQQLAGALLEAQSEYLVEWELGS
jgi:alpha-galactosidase/6-phospho-beta-glucosidase family protein